MARTEAQKAKLLWLSRFFEEETDEANPATMQDIIAYLDAQGIPAERKGLYRDIALLQDFGYDILQEPRGHYYLGERTFSLPELRLLTDAVQCSKFISEKKSRQFIEKLGGLTSRSQRRVLSRYTSVIRRAKTPTEQLLYTVEYYNGWEAFHPTQAAQIDFEMKNGKKWFEEGSGYDENHPYANRDPRFYYCIAAPFYPYGSVTKDGAYSEDPLLLYYQYDDMTRDDFLVSNNPVEPAYSSKAKQTASGNHGGLELYKWYIPTSYISESQTGSLLYPWFRLGEMYLNYAEAAYMLGKEAICREYINKIRQRPDVMMPEVTESGDNLWDRLVNERRVELYAETFRYFDLRRWKMADFYENVPLASGKVMVLKKGNKMDTIFRVARLYDPARNNTNYYWPNLTTKEGAKPSETYVYQPVTSDPRYGKPIEYIITYKWLGKEYTIDYGDCILNQNPTPRCFPADGRNYLMPIPRNEITKSEGKLQQNPGY